MATIKDIAKASGVSYPTVSNAMTGKRKVSAKTQAKIQDAMERLRYVPNGVARGLRSSRMNTLGIVLPYRLSTFMNDHCYGPITDSILVSALDLDQSVMINVAEEYPAGAHGIRKFCDGRIDGLLLIGQPTDCALVASLKAREFPFVCITEAATTTDIPYVDADQEGLCRLLVEHLYELGHRKYVVLSGDENLVNAGQRLSATRQTFELFGVSPIDSPQLPGNYSQQSGYKRVCQFLKSRPKVDWPTAIICLNDFIAHGALDALSDLGISCPNEISVVGIDDVPTSSSIQHLTTVRLPLELIGKTSVAVVHQIINGSSGLALQQNLPGTLIVRATSGPPPKSA